MDARDAARIQDKWYISFDEREMKCQFRCTLEHGEVETVMTIPVLMHVCPLCQGKGKHVNPSIDSNGLNWEYFDDDPAFEEDYFGGAYDVTCFQCDGLRVVPEPDFDKASDLQVWAYRNELSRRYYAWKEREAELRYQY